MSYYYSNSDIEDMYRVGILHRPRTSTQEERDLIQKNTECPKCGGGVIVSKDETITCKDCKHIL